MVLFYIKWPVHQNRQVIRLRWVPAQIVVSVPLLPFMELIQQLLLMLLPGVFHVSSNSSTAVAATSIITVSANDAVIMFGMAAGNNPTWSGWTTTSPGTLTELYDAQEPTNDNASVGAAWAIKATAGATGAGAATLSSSRRATAGFCWH